MTPPPAMISCRFDARISADGAIKRASVGERTPDMPDAGLEELRRIVEAFGLHVLREGQHHRSGFSRLVSTRIAAESRGHELFGRWMRSQYLHTGWKQSLTLTSPRLGDSSCCSTGSGRRDAKNIAGKQQHRQPLMVAAAAPVSMLVAPGPIDVVQASVASRFRIFAKAAAACTMPCSLRAW